MIKLLPNWIISSDRPAFYDTESATAIEQTAKIYAKTNEVVEEVNKFVEETNNDINAFKAEIKQEQTVFETAMRQEFQDFINVVDIKIEQTVNNILSQSY